MGAVMARRVAASLILILGLAVLGWGCSPSIAPRPSASAAVPSEAAPSASPILTPVPGASGGSLPPPVSVPSTTMTEFGEIWDALPPSFPTLPGAIPTAVQGPTSAAFALGTDAETASRTVAAGLQAQGWTVDVGSPLEDGTVVLDATGPATGCKAEVRFTPLSGTVTMSVLYGAECPFG
jgi:hypothetical protein